MKRLHLIISGDVQGVGFRSWVRFHAQRAGLSGWVKNREDQTVELVAEGGKEALEALKEECRKGPDVARVQHVEEKWGKATGEYQTFSVVY
jgi:acylphosphatase